MKYISFDKAGKPEEQPLFFSRNRCKNGHSVTECCSRNDFLTSYKISTEEFRKEYLFDRKNGLYKKLTNRPIEQFAQIKIWDMR